jgi:hypothetical protein
MEKQGISSNLLSKNGKRMTDIELAEKYLSPEEVEKVRNLPPISERDDRTLDIMADLLADEFLARYGGSE